MHHSTNNTGREILTGLACPSRFLILFILFVIALEGNEVKRINWSEGIFMLYATGQMTASSTPRASFCQTDIAAFDRLHFGQSSSDARARDERFAYFLLLVMVDQW